MCFVHTSLISGREISVFPAGGSGFIYDTQLRKVVKLSRFPYDLARLKLQNLSGRSNVERRAASRNVKCFEDSGLKEKVIMKDSVEEVSAGEDKARDVGGEGKDDSTAQVDAYQLTSSRADSGVHANLAKKDDAEGNFMTLESEEVSQNHENARSEGPASVPEKTSCPHEALDSSSTNVAKVSEQRTADKIGGVGNKTTVTPKPQDHGQDFSMQGLPLQLGTIWGPFWERLKNNPLAMWVKQWNLWQEKQRLEYLLALADANPMDASKQRNLLSELNKHSPEAVIKRFEQRAHAADAQVVVEYLRALVVTNAITEYLPDERSGKRSSLPALLQELRQRATGNMDEPFATPGMTDKHPLHVVMVDPKGASKSMRFMQELISTCLFMIFFSVMWVMFAAFLRKYVSSMGGMGTSSGISTSTAYAPKEYSKETLPEKNTKTFKDVKGCDEAKEELEEIVEYLKNPAKFTRLGGKLPKGVLLTGPPGTGKTLLAKAIAGEAGVPFFYRAGSEFEEMFVGVGARRVRALFQAAKKKAPCIIFIDEIDAVGSTRKQWEGHTKKTLHQLLVEMDGFEPNEGIIVVAATNLPEALDPALTRPGRFDRHVVVTNPDVRGRQEILDLYLHNKPLADDVDVKLLARGTPGFNGADLANLVNMAALKAAVEGTDKITNAQLEFAKDKIVMGTERKSFVQSEESRRMTAYHESGHAVVAFNTAGAHPIHKATITPRGNALGMVSQIPEKDETSVSKIQMLARLDVAMGGRVAEEMIFGMDQVTTGARSDLQHATALARHMVSECGMSDRVGPIFIALDDQRPGQEIQRTIDAEVVRLLREAYERVKTLLKKHESGLHALASALLEQETLNAKDIQKILSPFRQQEETAEVTSS